MIVDLEKGVIKFDLAKSELIVPIVKDIVNVLTSYINGLSDDENYLFLNDDVDYNVNTLSKRINYFLNNKINEINIGADYKMAKITHKDLKILRGQHLYLDNVPIEIIHSLYNNFNLNETKDFIDYEGLNKSKLL